MIAQIIGLKVPIGQPYTALYQDGIIWMSDVLHEREEHLRPAREIHNRKGRVLIAGLGIGCILRSAILSGATHVDVDIIGLVGPHYRSLAKQHNVNLNIINQSIFDVPVDSDWDVAWFDIWEGVHDYKNDESFLRTKFQDHVNWIGFWGEDWTGMLVAG